MLHPHPIFGEAHMRPDRIDMGDGLLLRWSTKDDEANVASLMADVFRVGHSTCDIRSDQNANSGKLTESLLSSTVSS